jgi:hypothetical protein
MPEHPYIGKIASNNRRLVLEAAFAHTLTLSLVRERSQKCDSDL